MAPSDRTSANYVTSMFAKSSAGDNADVVLWADPSTHALLTQSSGGSGGTAATDNSAFTAGTTSFTPIGGFYHSTIDAVTDGRAAAVAIDAKRNMFVVIRDAAGNARGLNIDASGQLAVTLAAAQTLGTVTTVSTVTAVTTVSTVTNLAQMNGAALLMGNGATGTGSQRVTIASDNTPFPIKLDQTTPGTTNAIALAQINAATTLAGNGATGTGSLRVTIANDNTGVANMGHGATAANVPAGITYDGKRGTTALPTAVSDGQSVGAMADKFGRTVSLVGTIRDLTATQTTTISASTSETTIVTAGAAGVFNDLIMLIVSNTSTATNTRIDFRDATSGSILFSLQSNGGQPPVGFALAIPIPQTTAANNWTAQCATSTTDIRVYAVFAKNK